MILKYKCLVCLEPMSKKVGFREWYHIKLGMCPTPTCEECEKALLKIGLARFSDVTLEIEEQRKKWLEYRGEILKDEKPA